MPPQDLLQLDEVLGEPIPKDAGEAANRRQTSSDLRSFVDDVDLLL